MDLRDIGWQVGEWVQLAQDRNQWRTIVNAVMNLMILAPRSQLCIIVHMSFTSNFV
jgi:hypothetical protein